MKQEDNTQLSQAILDEISTSLENEDDKQLPDEAEKPDFPSEQEQPQITEAIGGECITSEKQEYSAVLENLEEEKRELGKRIDSLEFLIRQQQENYKKTMDNFEALVDQLDRVNKNLHKENQELKQGMYDSIQKPILKDVINICSDLIYEVNIERKNGRTDAAECLEDILERLHMVLEMHGVEVYEPKEGDRYEPLIQKVIGTVDTFEDRHRTIAEVKNYGYRYVNHDDERIVLAKGTGNIMLAPAKVIVYRMIGKK